MSCIKEKLVHDNEITDLEALWQTYTLLCRFTKLIPINLCVGQLMYCCLKTHPSVQLLKITVRHHHGSLALIKEG